MSLSPVTALAVYMHVYKIGAYNHTRACAIPPTFMARTLFDGAIEDRIFNVGHSARFHLEAPPVVTRLKTEKKLEQIKTNKKDLRRRWSPRYAHSL